MVTTTRQVGTASRRFGKNDQVSHSHPLLLLAYTGIIIRNLLLGTFADAVLAKRSLLVAVPDPEDEYLLDIVQEKPITLIPFPCTTIRPSSRIAKIATWETYMHRFRQAEKKLQPLVRYHRRSRFDWVGTRALIGLGHIVKHVGVMGTIERKYLRSISRRPETAQWCQLLKKHRPAVLVSTMLTLTETYKPNVDLPAVVAADQLGLPVGTLVQSWDNLTTKPVVLPPWLSRYWTWSTYMTEELLTMNPRVPSSRVKWVGSPQFDFHLQHDMVMSRQTFMKQVGLEPEQPYVLYGTNMGHLLPDEPDRLLSLIEALHHRLPNCQVLVRLHPLFQGGRWEAYRPRLAMLGAVIQDTAVEKPWDEGGFTPLKMFYREQINAISHAAVVVNTASTLTVDAAILDRPIISIGYDLELDTLYPEGRAWTYNHSIHFGSLVATGGVSVARSEVECIGCIERYLEHPEYDQEGRHKIVKQVTQYVDGRAGDRLAQEVLRLAEKQDTATNLPLSS